MTLASCSVVGPQYQRPAIPLDAQFAASTKGALSFAAEDPWWERLHDPVLTSFVEKTLARNIQIDAALARIAEARAIIGTVNPRSQLSGNLSGSATVRSVERDSNSSAQSQVSATYLFDLFGQRRRQQEQAEALLEAAVQEEAALRLALQAEATQIYLNARFLQASMRIRKAAVRNRSRLVSILRERGLVGDSTQVQLRRAQAELRLEQARLPALEGDFKATAFALATLSVEPAESVLEILARGGGQPVPTAHLNPDVPAALLRNRPDVRASEARLVAATAEIGVLEAQLYPSLSLGGTIGVSTNNTISFGPSLVAPLFDLPARRARIAAGRARAEEAEANYRQTVLEAVEEVQVSLAQTQSLQEQSAALQRAQSTYRDAVSLSQEAFSLNAITLIEVLGAEEDLRDTSLTLAGARRDYAATWAQLNIAIGQGRDVVLQRTAE
ncbi:efflux transporter outer membrane subunit [uncultured Tateyamaria sp.]|nr:efflux transporter outer membrane subunit [uncultured Tateyamaria sp.]